MPKTIRQALLKQHILKKRCRQNCTWMVLALYIEQKSRSIKMNSYLRRSCYRSSSSSLWQPDTEWVLMKKQKMALIAFFLLFLCTSLEPEELSTGPLLRRAVAGELRLSGRLHFRLRSRGDRIWWGPFWAEGRVISQDPCSVSAPGYCGYSRGSSLSSP